MCVNEFSEISSLISLLSACLIAYLALSTAHFEKAFFARPGDDKDD